MYAVSRPDDYDFRPRLGRIGEAKPSRSSSMKAFLKTARNAGSKFSGSVGRPAAFSGARRVYIQARIHRLSGSGGGAQRAHVSYLEREGAGRGEERAEFYNENTDGLNGQDWLKDHTEDRHHFRFIVSPEDGDKLKDLKPFVRDLVSQMEIDLGTKLDWIAVDHFNTEHPHTHIVMSGKRDDGKDLVIPRDYLSHGMRERASALVTRELGLQSEAELSAKLSQEAGLHKPARMDRVLLREQHRNQQIDIGRLRRNRDHYKARLETLRDIGLASHQSGTIWTIDESLGTKLRQLEKSGLIAERIERAVSTAGLERAGAHEQGAFEDHKPVQGRLLTIGYADELTNASYTIVDGLDGRAHYFDLGTRYTQGLEVGDMIDIKPRSPGATEMDRAIAAIAKDVSGFYSRKDHIAFDPSASERHLDAFERRLETLRKARLIERFNDGSALIRDDFLDKVDKHFEKLSKHSPTIFRKLEHRDFQNQIAARGDTWLDHQLAGTAKKPLGYSGLGGEVRSAMDERMEVHKARGLVTDPKARSLTETQLKTLQREGMDLAAQSFAKDTARKYKPLEPGKEFSGSFKQTLSTPHAKYAIVSDGLEFALVPWSRGLERMQHRQLQMTMSPGMDIS